MAWAAVALAGLSFAAAAYNLFGVDQYNESLAIDSERPLQGVPLAGYWIDAVVNTVATVASVVAAVFLVRMLRTGRWLAIAGGAGATLYGIGVVLAAVLEGGPQSAPFWADTLAYAGAIMALAYLGACVAAAAWEGGDGAWTPSLLAILAWALAAETAGIVGYGFGLLASSPSGGWYLLTAPMYVFALAMLVRAALGPAGRAGWVALLALLTTSLAAQASAVFFEDGDSVTESMESGFTFLAYAALGVLVLRAELHRALAVGRRIGRATIVPLALALLFATAEVVQNFTSSERGLYAGGAVAFLTVLLANPIQKRLEGRTHRGKNDSDAVAKYRRLVETAWTDGHLGANERLLLAEARRQLGLDAETAGNVDEEVAANHVQGPGNTRKAAPKSL